MAKILSLNLTNFQGVVSQSINFGGVDTTIYGRNGTGKSTIANATAWLLYDKAANGAKNYSPKTYGADGHLHNLDHTAEMEIVLDGGTVLTLKRVYHEIYHKKRGTNIEEFDGHETDHYLDGVPVTEKEYKARVAEICPPDTAKVLTQPGYFAESMSKDDRRRTLLSVCGDISDADVIRETPEISDLPAVLRKPGISGDCYTVDEYRRIAAARKTEINRELSAIPSRIDEATRAIPEVVLDPENDAKIAAKRVQIDGQNQKLAEIKTPASNAEADAAIRAQIATIEAQISEGRAKYAEQTNAVMAAYNAQINDVHTRVASLKLDLVETSQEVIAKQREVGGRRQDLEATKLRRITLLNEYNEVSEQKWDTSKETCPTCKQQLPQTDIEAMRQEFNMKRSDRLAVLQAAGKEVGKSVIAAKELAIEESEKEIAAMTAMVARIEKNITTTHNELDKIKTPRPSSYEETPEYKTRFAALNKAKAERSQKSDTIMAGASEAIRAQEAVIKGLSDELAELLQVKANLEQIDKLKARINELSEQEKKLAADYEQTERGLYLCELFVRAKVSMLTNAINGKFTKVRFRLFKEQINGGLVDDCEVLVPGQAGAFVPWGEGANTGAKINAGLEIIGVLSKHWGASLPIICDNAECVSHWTEIDAQVVKLVVTTTDDVLRVEREAEK